MGKSTEQQIDEAIAILKSVLISKAANKEQEEEIKHRLDSLGNEAKAVFAILDDQDIYKAACYAILSQKR